MKFEVITPEGLEYEGKIEKLHITTIEGDLTILPHHFPLLTNTVISLCYFIKEGERIDAFINEGIMHVDDEGIKLILASFDLKENIDIERARNAKERAKARLESNDPSIDIKRAQKALIRAEARISLWGK